MRTTPHDRIFTSTGRRVRLVCPDPAAISIVDIAAGLAKACRYNGQCAAFYSVAQHSILVSMSVPPRLALEGLLHDAAEAYLGDCVQPLKRYLAMYQCIETMWEDVLAGRFSLNTSDTARAIVKRADRSVLLAERRDLLHPEAMTEAWFEDAQAKPLGLKIHPLDWREAELAFLERWAALAR